MVAARYLADPFKYKNAHVAAITVAPNTALNLNLPPFPKKSLIGTVPGVSSFRPETIEEIPFEISIALPGVWHSGHFALRPIFFQAVLFTNPHEKQ